MILPIPFRISASSPLENAGVGQPGPQDRIGIYDMRRSQKHERQSHEKRRNEDHDKILQNTAPVCGKAGIDLLDVGKKVRNPSAQTGERAQTGRKPAPTGTGTFPRSPLLTPYHSQAAARSMPSAVSQCAPAHSPSAPVPSGRDTTYAGTHGSSRRRRAGR